MAATAELTRLDQAIDRGTRRLLELQRPDGIWVGELESNVTMTAQHLFWHHYLDLRTPELDRRIANELLARRRDDGTWSIWFEGPPDLSTSIEAYVALPARRRRPGAEGARVHPARGRHPEEPAVHEVLHGAARPVAVAADGTDPARARPPAAGVALLHLRLLLLGAADVRRARGRAVAAPRASGRRRPDGDRREAGPDASRRGGRTRSAAGRCAVAERWIRERQEADGSWGGIQPPWVWGIIALAALGNGLDDRRSRKAVEGWQGFMVDDGERLRPEACQSPVWDTGLAVLGAACLRRVRRPPAARRAPASTSSRRRCTSRATGRFAAGPRARRLGVRVRERSSTPTSTTRLSCRSRSRQLDIGEEDAIARGLDWLVGMQSRGGGWGSFDVDNDAMWLYKIPFCDFGKVTDEPSADVTAHSLEALGTLGVHATQPSAASSGCSRSRRRTARGSGAGASTTSTAPAPRCPALEACGIPHDHPSMRRAVAWLDSVQQESGGFGEDIRSYADPAWRGRAEFTTPSQTAWALLAYVAAGNAEDSSCRAGRQTISALRSARTVTGTRSTSPARDSPSTS